MQTDQESPPGAVINASETDQEIPPEAVINASRNDQDSPSEAVMIASHVCVAEILSIIMLLCSKASKASALKAACTGGMTDKIKQNPATARTDKELPQLKLC